MMANSRYHLQDFNGRLVFIESYEGSVVNPMRTGLKMRNGFFALFLDADKAWYGMRHVHTNEAIISIKIQILFRPVLAVNPAM